MQPRYLSLLQVFGAPARYTVPLFQRPYVWDQEEQWDPLWEDVRDLVERTLSAGAGKPVAGHFLGTVVLEQMMTNTGTIACREIIDGQQRLTTLQILLKAAEHVLTDANAEADEKADETSAKELRVAAQQIAILTANTAYADAEEKYKVWPTNDDRVAFRTIMDANTLNEASDQGERIIQAYHYFRKVARDWVRATPQVASRARALSSALQNHVWLIVLDLEDIDEPQAIFETLNAHGTPLLPADLIKNWLLWEASRRGLKNTDELYRRWWRAFDHDQAYWRAKVGTGHAARPRVDTFLQNWLTRRTRDSIPAKHLYNKFRQYGSSEGAPNVSSIMADIHHHASWYREIEFPTGSTRFHVFLRRLSQIGIVVFYPVLLALMGRPGSDNSDRDAAATALESYLVRRIVCWEDTRAYNEVMLNILSAIENLDAEKPAAPTVIDVLAKQSSQKYSWPDNNKFRTAWLSNKFYQSYRRTRVLMILQSLEEYYQKEGDKGEPIVSFNFSGLEIEHIMPQEWEKNWPLDAEVSKIDRDRRLHGIGNLTLVTGKLNPALSNAAWLALNEKKGKRNALDEHSKLQLNARLVKRWQEDWSESTIDDRASALYEAARKIWPLPEDFSALG
jgi:hypothetical protein